MAESRRLFVRAALRAGAEVDLDRAQAHYLVNVLRLKPGDSVLAFNGRDGEWRAQLAERRRTTILVAEIETWPQTAMPDLAYLFAPLKQGRLDYMVQKAVEMGAGRLVPVLTQFTQVGRPNAERMEANAIEAAEQCGLLSIPTIGEPVALTDLLDRWAKDEPDRRILHCDEDAAVGDPVTVLQGVTETKLAVLVGPEGGFSAAEREKLRAMPLVTAVPLGPRILRSDTAAVAALALVQAVKGDWKRAPRAV